MDRLTDSELAAFEFANGSLDRIMPGDEYTIALAKLIREVRELRPIHDAVRRWGEGRREHDRVCNNRSDATYEERCAAERAHWDARFAAEQIADALASGEDQ